MRNKTDQLLKVMSYVSWVVFIGLLIKTGTILTTYFISITNEAAAENLFGGLDLSSYRAFSFVQYTFVISYKIFLFAAEAYVAFLVARLLGKLDLKTPFNITVHSLMEKISYSILSIWIVAILHNAQVRYLAKKNDLPMDLFSSDFIFLAGIIFIFAQIIKRGIEIQSENDLTI